MNRDAPTLLLAVLGVLLGANGVFMLLDSVRWFGLVAAVTGDLNVHFVRDVGAAYLTVGVALFWAAREPRARLPLTATAAVFLGLHALGHVYETATGELPSHQLWPDLPGVYLPALLTGGLALHFLRTRPSDRRTG